VLRCNGTDLKEIGLEANSPPARALLRRTLLRFRAVPRLCIGNEPSALRRTLGSRDDQKYCTSRRRHSHQPRHLTSAVKSMSRMRNDRGTPYYPLCLRGSTAAHQTGDRELATVERERFNQYALLKSNNSMLDFRSMKAPNRVGNEHCTEPCTAISP
jgi:hypothetical protein